MWEGSSKLFEDVWQIKSWVTLLIQLNIQILYIKSFYLSDGWNFLPITTNFSSELSRQKKTSALQQQPHIAWWQPDRPWVFYPHAQLSEDLGGGHLAVQRVEVEARHLTALQQHSAHLHRLVDAVVADGGIVVFDGLDDLGDLLGDLQFRQFDQLAQRLVALGVG